MTMRTEIFSPSAALSDFVMCYWNLDARPEGTPKRNTIVPDGTMKLIFHYGDTYVHHTPSGGQLVLPRCFLIGQLTRPFVVEPKGATGSFIVRFHPAGLIPFATAELRNLENTALPLGELFGRDGLELGEMILNAHSIEQRIKIIENFLLKRLNRQTITDRVVKESVNILLNEKGKPAVRDLSRQCGISPKHLNRKFSETVGLTPKQFAQTVRIQTALKMLITHDDWRLTDLAFESEYFDQAHFIRQFRKFTGITPKRFYGDDLTMSTIFDRSL